jgi:predicted amidohydrolase
MNSLAENPSIRLAIYQYTARDETPHRRLQRLDDMLRSAKDAPFDLVVCPELFISGYNAGDKIAAFSEAQDGPAFQAAGEIARKHQTTLIYGYPENAGERRFNSAMVVGVDGRRQGNHRKLRIPNGFETQWFVPGDSHTMIDVAGFRIALLVCYDVEFPETVRACALAGAEIIVAPTALKAEWGIVARQLIPSRAFENGVFLAYANYCGRENGFVYLGESCIIGPDGGEIARAGADETLLVGVLKREDIARARTRLPYLEHRRDLDSVAVGEGRRPLNEPDAI